MTDPRMSLRERLRERREDLTKMDPKYTQGEIGKRLPGSPKQSTVSLYEREPERLIAHGPAYAETFFREYGFSEGEVASLTLELFSEYARALGLSKADSTVIVRGNQRVKVYATGTGPPWADDEVLEVLDIPGLPPSATPYVGLKAMGDSMSPYLRRGDVAVILRDEGAVKPGDCCGIWIADDGCIVKEFVQELPDGRLLLKSYNPAPGEHQYFPAPLGSRILGPVVKRVLDG